MPHNNRNSKDIEIKFVKSWQEDEIVDLYKAGGWWKEKWDTSGVKNIIEKSYVFAVAVETKKGKAIGMGRVISDGISDAYIQDLVVLPEYRGLKIGKRLVDALLKYCLSNNIGWIGLVAEPGSERFYSNLDFESMKDYVFMRFQKED